MDRKETVKDYYDEIMKEVDQSPATLEEEMAMYGTPWTPTEVDRRVEVEQVTEAIEQMPSYTKETQ